MKKLTLTVICLLEGITILFAQPGFLDPTFGMCGIVTTNVGTNGSNGAHGIALQPDGKIIAVGGGAFHFALTRYDSAGALDNTFGTAGKVNTAVLGTGTNSWASAVKLQPDGKILVTGEIYASEGVVRYNADGTLDNTFGSGSGLAYTSAVSNWDQRAQAIALQADGKIVLAGYASGGSSVDYKMVAVRFTANGLIDNTFGTSGIASVYVNSFCKATGVAIQPDGKIVLAGWACNITDTAIALVRFDASGNLDNSFGTGGQVVTNLTTGDDEAAAISLQSDGKIVVCGKSGNNFAVLRYNTNGTPDASFGTAGVTLTSMATSNNYAYSLGIQPDGKIVVAGQADLNFGIARYNSNGLLDTSFGTGGKIITTINGSAFGVAIQPDGKIVSVGGVQAGGYDDFTVLRYNANGSNYTPPSPNWEWAKSAGGNNDSQGSSTCKDVNGNICVTGFFSSTITFGNTVLTNAGGRDMFIVKYDSGGNVIWAKSAGGINDDSGNGICTDINGNIFIAGQFTGSTMNIESTILTGAGAVDMFIIKYDSSGNMLWAKSAGGTDGDNARSVSTDANGNAYVTGGFYSPSITFGSNVFVNSNPLNWNDAYLTKYDPSGNVIWAKNAGINYSEEGNFVKTDGFGNVYMTGVFEGPSITFGSIVLTNPTGSGRNVFIVKYDSTGNALWAKNAGYGTYSNNGSGLDIDNDNNVYLTGDFSGPTITFDAIVLTNSNPGNNNVFIVKYDPTGNVIWAKKEGGIYDAVSSGISINVNGYLYITGISSSISFENSTCTNIYNSFITKYDLYGNLLWAKNAGDKSASITTDANDDVFITGYYQNPTIAFDTIVLTNSWAPVWHLFVAKIKGDLSVNGNCTAHYSTSYDSIQNNFTLIVDSISLALATGYHWSFGDGTTSTLASPTHVYSIDSLYNVCMKIYSTSGDSCIYCHIIGKDSSGIILRNGGFTLNVQNSIITDISQNLSNETKIVVYPNPTNGNFTLIGSGIAKIEIYNVLGELFYKTSNLKQQISREIDLSKSPKGIYFVKCYVGPNVYNQKIIVQ